MRLCVHVSMMEQGSSSSTTNSGAEPDNKGTRRNTARMRKSRMRSPKMINLPWFSSSGRVEGRAKDRKEHAGAAVRPISTAEIADECQSGQQQDR